MHLRWNANGAAPVDLATNYDGQNNTVTYSGPGTLQTLPYITTPDYTPIVGTFRHYVGPTKSKNYKLEVFQIGSGAAISTCTDLTTTGSTIAFQQPINGTATTNLLDRIRLQWTNKSKLSETFKIFRGGVLRGVIAGSEKLDSVFTWEDVYSADDSLSIVNGTAYSYCIETYCNNLNSSYTPQLCRTGNTFNLNVTASDNSPTNKVNVSWANVASYGYNIQIKRDGILIATLPAATVTFADANPIYGKVAKYEVCLIDPDNSDLIVSKSDNGSVPARGIISGRASTLEGNYALKNVRIKLHSLVDTLVNLTTYTDYLGNFSFNNLYYEFAGQFELTADYGNHIFVGGTKTVTLNDVKFAVTNVEFFDSTGLTVSATPLAVNGFIGTPMPTQDKIDFAWNTQSTSSDTIIYDLYREATRIATNILPKSNALAFDGGNDHLQVPADNYFGGGNFTAEAWVYMRSYASWSRLFDFGNGQANNNILFGLTNATSGKPFFQIYNGTTGSAYVTSNTAIPLNQWAHVAVTLNGTTATIYINGGVVATGTTFLPPNINRTNCYIGRSNWSVDSYFNGLMDEFRLWNVARTQAQIQSAMHTSVPANSTGLRLYYPFNEGIAGGANAGITTTTNASANSTVNATLQGFLRSGANSNWVTGLLSAVSSTYTDLTGEPNVSYKYRLNAYKIQNGVITAKELADTLLFPQVAVPTGFTAVANATLGVINMAWSHTSSNYDGFRIYRNGKQIADLPAGTFAYTDADAKPGTSATYILKAKRFLNNITFESLGQTVSNVNIPALPAVTGVTATASTARNSVLVSWTIPAALISTYNYDGFRVYRRLSSATAASDVYIGQLPKAINPPFEDKNAVPSTAYTYTVKSYLRLSDNSIGESAGASANAICPIVTSVTALTASATLAGEVALSWTPPSTAIRNLDGIVVLRGSDTLAVLPYNATTFRVFTNSTVSTSYSVRVFRNVAGVRRFSAALSASGKAATGSTTIEFATNVSATQNLANHVRLSWEYPSYVLSIFKIYRDNVLVATLPTESRVYLDNAAVAGTTHFYQIEAINGANTSQRAGAQGRLRSIRELNGMVYSNTDKYGVPNVDVYVTGTGYTGHTKTDSSGYYVFAGLPETAGTSMTVFVDGYGTNHTTTFTPTSQTFAISAGANVYTRNFGSSYTPAITDTIAPTRPMNIIATPNPSRRRVSVTWTPSNTFYDGFEVYRANVLLANVKKGENLIAYDTAGYPGISYTYQIRSYQYTTGANKYSNFYFTTGTYPVLEAPIFVTTTPNLALNTLKLTWSHNWDNHTRYEISRNDSLLTTVNTKAVLEYTDNTGIPGQQYVYSVTAVMVVGSKTHYSDPSTISIQYPTVAEAGNFAVTSPTFSTSYTAPCATNVNQERNFVDLDWTYDANALLKGFRVYREQTLLATLPKDSLHYRDYNGIPGNFQAYTIKSILEREGDNYYSQGTTTSKTYPTLATPQNVMHKDTLGAKQISWAYPDGGASGFYILRGTAVIDTVLADSMGQKSFVFLDKTGVSGTSYNYTIRAYTKRNDVKYWADDYTCLTGLVYPKPLTPTNVAASDGTYTSYVKVNWTYPSGADISGFHVFRNGTQIATVAGGIKEYYHLNVTTTGAYSVKAYKTASFQGTSYTNYSDISNSDNGHTSQGATSNSFDITSAVASAGTLNGQTRIDWGFPTASNGSILGFKVYRDNSLVQTASTTDRYFYDANGVAGKHYIYEVCAYTGAGDQARKAAEGWSKPDGYLEGRVVTTQGGGGVGGVSIQAVATIEGNDYIYNTTTDINGNYAIADVYYGNSISNFTLTANYGDHLFLANPIYTTLSPQNKSRVTLFFNDRTAYVIAGTVGRREVSCYLDSIHVYGEYILVDSTTEMFSQDAYTQPDGSYSLSVNPYKPNAIGARIYIDSTRVLLTSRGSDTLHYRFNALNPTSFTSLANFPQNTTLNFEDTLLILFV
jgi:hypothetical protein